MGEIADQMLDGEICQGCGMDLGEIAGFPTYCAGCQSEGYGDDDAPANEPRPAKTINCPAFPKCERRFRTRNAAARHWIDKHED